MVAVIYEGYVCVDCVQVIANDEWSGIEDAVRKAAEIDVTALGELGHVVMACPDGCEGEFRTDPCDYCGDPLAGDRHPIAVLA